MSAPSGLSALPLEFLGSFPDPAHRLAPPLPEVAFLGRSNVGKSSLLNALLGRVVARVSSTPGKTQLLNVFRLPGLYLLDLPGYGFARASHAERRRFRQLIEGVLREREGLSGVVWLLDIRHPPSQDDLEIRELLRETRRPVLAVLTKADKLPRGQRRRAALERALVLELAPEEVLVASSRTGEGVAELGRSVLAVGTT